MEGDGTARLGEAALLPASPFTHGPGGAVDSTEVWYGIRDRHPSAAGIRGHDSAATRADRDKIGATTSSNHARHFDDGRQASCSR